MSTPNRPADRTQSNVGKRFGPPQSTALAPDNNFAGTTYVTGCSGNTATNPDQPPFRYELNDGTTLNSNNLTVTESDGTVKQYFVNGNEVATDFYIKNSGLTEGQYNALSQSQKNLYCDSPVGGTGGAVTGLKIVDRGDRLYAANDPGVNTGSGGAKITVTVNSAGQVTGTNIVSGGSGYRVGDTFSVVQGKPSFAYPQSGLLEVTSVSGGSGGKYYLSNPSNSGTRVREVSRQLNVRIWDPVDDNGGSDGGSSGGCEPVNTLVSSVTAVGSKSGTVYGSGPYRLGSDIATAAVHAGLLSEGESGTIDLYSAGPNKISSFSGSTANGVTAFGLSGANADGCGVNLIKRNTGGDTGGCVRGNNTSNKEIVVGTTGLTLGIPTAIEIVNPNTNPNLSFPTPTTASGDYNWYYSCPVSGSNPPGTDRFDNCPYFWRFVGGPSDGSGQSKGTIAFTQNTRNYVSADYTVGCDRGATLPNGQTAINNWHSEKVILATNFASWNPQPGHAIGDIWEFFNFDCGDNKDCEFCPTANWTDKRVQVRVTAIDASGGGVQTESKLTYRVEKDILLQYPPTNSNLNSANNTMVLDFENSADTVLNESATLVIDKFIILVGRTPRDLEFQVYLNRVYDDGAAWSSATQTKFQNDFPQEISYFAVSGNPGPTFVGCNGDGSDGGDDDDDDDGGNPIGGDTNCKYDRNTFYRGTGGTSNGQVDLYELWSFLGSPRNNPNPVCPRPQNDSGLTQDNEPDMTDFAGMKLQKWKACTDGSNNGNANLGSFDEITVPCDGDLDLGFFIDTRIAPWWGTQELEPPSLSFTQTNDNIFMINIPPTQNEEYFFKASPTTDSSGKKFFSVKGSINFPNITGQPTAGEPAIPTTRNTRVNWYKLLNNGNLEGEAYYDRLGRTNNQGITNLGGNQMTATGSLSSGQSGNFETTLTLNDAIDGKTTGAGAEELDFNTSGDVWVCRIVVDNRPDNPKAPGTFLPGFGGITNNAGTYQNRQSKFLLNNIDCQDASISCGGSSTKEVKTGEPTTITFSMRINTNCLQYRSGTARISIKREWPCPVFGPADPRRNQWLVEKATVGIPQTNQSSALIQYTLTVPTDRQDYLAGDPGVDVDPGNCHWNYRAYWEIDYPGVDCSSTAWTWRSDDCNAGSGLQQLPEIYCSQQQYCGNNSNNNPSPSNSNCSDAADWGPGDYDYSVCLPYCFTKDTYGCAKSFYWCYQQPNPGVNCSGSYDGTQPSPGPSGPPTGESPYGAGCECPICEQSIQVVVLDTTECGLMGKPNQVEGGGAGPNNAIVNITSPKEGNFSFTDVSFNPTILPKDVLKDCSDGPGKCLNLEFDSWVYLTRKTLDTFTTLGNDAAIRIVDYDKNEVDCSETVFTQQSWFVKKKYKNGTSSGLQPLPIYLGGAQFDPYLNKYNPSAGSNTQAMLYRNEEVGNSSKKTAFGFIDDLSYDIETVKSVEIFLNITSTNDYFGNVQYNPPPAGYFARDFGTTTSVTSPRGAVGASPGVSAQKGTFQVANFSVADIIDLPEFKSPAGISCPPSTVPYDGVRVTPDIFEFCCGGEIGGCQNTGVSFACQGACEGGGCDKQPLPGPKQEITATATNADGVFAIDWKDIKPAERKQLTILWYFGKSQFSPCCINEGNLSQGDTISPDINNVSKLAQPETSYQLGYYIVASSDGEVSYREIQYDETGNNGYFDRLSWLLTPNINSCNRPYQTTGEVKDGERWQTIMGSGFCTITTGPDLDTVSIQNPTGSIVIENITNPDGSTGPGSPSGSGNCNKGECCNPASFQYYSSRCREIRDALQAGGIQCCSAGSFPGPGGGGPPGPGLGPNTNLN